LKIIPEIPGFFVRFRGLSDLSADMNNSDIFKPGKSINLTDILKGSAL
jgi:hypothetical protein